MRFLSLLSAVLFFFPGVRAESSSDAIEKTIVDEISSFITFIADIIKNYVIEPPMRILKELFGGVADSIGTVGTSMFSGVKGLMDSTWQNTADSLSILGPFAPIAASIIILGVATIVIWFVFDIILDMVLPKPFEEEIED